MPIACVHCAKAKAKCDKKVSKGSQTTYHRKRQMWRSMARLWSRWLHTFGKAVGFSNLLLHASAGNKQLIDSAGAVLAMYEQADSLPIESDSAIISGTLTSREHSSAAAFGACFACLGRLPYLAIIIPTATA
jgi:hypothetical protein